MNSLKWNPGLLLVALAVLAFSLVGCQTTNWPQNFNQPGVSIDSAPIPESNLGTPADLGTDSHSSLFKDSAPSDSFTTRKPSPPARTPLGTKPGNGSVRPAPSRGALIVLGEPATKSLSRYLTEDFGSDAATARRFPVTEAPNRARKDSNSGIPRDEPLSVQLDDFDQQADTSRPSLDPVELTGPDLPLFSDSAANHSPPALQVDLPESMPVGNSSQVTVTVSGVPDELANQFRVNIRLSEALRRAGDQSQDFDVELMTSEGKPQTKISFPIVAAEPGAHSLEVSLRNAEEELSWKRISVIAKAGLLSIALTGPESKPLGANAEYTLHVHNTSGDSLGPITAIVEFDGTLIPREASEGAEQKSGRLVWQFPVLHPDEQIFLQVEFECPVESARACITARVQAGDRPPLQEQSCLKIFRPRGSIRLEVEDRDDLARPEQKLTAVVRITNLGLQPARDVRLSFDLPKSLRFKSHTVKRGDTPLDVPLADQVIQLLFEPVAELKPDQTLEFQLTFEAVTAGTGKFQARVTDKVHPEPLTAEEPFTVTP